MSGFQALIRNAIVSWRSGRTSEQMRAVPGARIIRTTNMVVIVPEPLSENAPLTVTAVVFDDQGQTVAEEQVAITDA